MANFSPRQSRVYWVGKSKCVGLRLRVTGQRQHNGPGPFTSFQVKFEGKDFHSFIGTRIAIKETAGNNLMNP